jgi:hypothetical protein
MLLPLQYLILSSSRSYLGLTGAYNFADPMRIDILAFYDVDLVHLLIGVFLARKSAFSLPK